MVIEFIKIDPRANVLRKYCHNLLKETENFNLPLFKLANKLEEIALNDSYFIKKNYTQT